MANWYPEDDAKLSKLWGEGFSAQQVSDRMPGRSRNAVIGRISRLGLTGRKTVVRGKNMQGRRVVDTGKELSRQSRKPGQGWYRPAKPGQATAPVPPIADNDPSEPDTVGLRKKLVDLDNNHCRWPMGDPRAADFGFCGLEKVPGVSYCEHHARRAFAGIPVRTGRPFRIWPAATTPEVKTPASDEMEGVE